jgi:hypothetical protein
MLPGESFFLLVGFQAEEKTLKNEVAFTISGLEVGVEAGGGPSGIILTNTKSPIPRARR